jgi:hypothetical protein
MQTKPRSWLFLLTGILLIILTSCGADSQTKTTTSIHSSFKNSTPAATVPPGENLYVLDGSGSNEQRIVAFHPTSTTARITVPAGLPSQDHKTVYSATPANKQTTITVTNTQSGSTLRTFAIPGTYTTAGQSYTTATLSPNGRWLALRQEVGQTSNIALVDTQEGRLVKTIKLDKNFYLDAISPAGNQLYLLQYLVDQPGRYYVRLYDTREDKLAQPIIADKSEIEDPRMSGSALTRQIARDGSAVYTLYIDKAHNIAFVHILPLIMENNLSYPPYIARCIDLPVGRSGNLLPYYSLALSADGTALYAANGALGIAAKISLEPQFFDDRITGSIHFDPGTVMNTKNLAQVVYQGAALSPDQNTLYFVGEQGIWSTSTDDISNSNARVQGHYLTQQSFTSVAVSTSGKMLYTVHPTDGITVYDIETGNAQQLTKSPVHTPQGIEWVTGP